MILNTRTIAARSCSDRGINDARVGALPGVFATLLGLFFLGFCAPALRAQDFDITLDPATTQINFTLAATMHTVHGTFKLKSGRIHWDPATGHAGGAIVIDAASATTDNDSRDRNMHAQVLESAKFAEIVFTPELVKGAVSPTAKSQVAVWGIIHLHDEDHEVTLPFSVEPAAGGGFQASTQFDVPYVKWGLKNPSAFLLHVGDTVNLEIHTSIRLAPAPQ